MDAIFIVRRMQEEYQKKDKKLYMCFVDMEKAFDGVPKKVMEWVMRKKGLSKVMVRAVMSLYGGAKTRLRMVLISIGAPAHRWLNISFVNSIAWLQYRDIVFAT